MVDEFVVCREMNIKRGDVDVEADREIKEAYVFHPGMALCPPPRTA